jgi:hypothetical protein
MDFETWWFESGSGTYGQKAAAKQAWEAAVKFEREACAQTCEEQTIEPECPERAQYCADAIRMRSNVEVRGEAPQALSPAREAGEPRL